MKTRTLTAAELVAFAARLTPGQRRLLGLTVRSDGSVYEPAQAQTPRERMLSTLGVKHPGSWAR